MPSSSVRSRLLLQLLAAVCQLRNIGVRQREIRQLALLLGEVTDALPLWWLVDWYVAVPSGPS